MLMRNIAVAALNTIQDYPSIAAGACIFAVAFSLVAGNALYSQPGGHPEPLWATRDNVTTRSVGARTARIPVRKVRTETVVPTEIPVPSSRPGAVSAEPAASDFVRTAQQELKNLGMYSGEVDGLYGPMTRTAIQNFQNAHSLRPDGEVTVGLVEAIRQAATAGPGDAGAPVNTVMTSSEDDQAPLRAEPASLTETANSVIRSAAEITRAAKVARIQIGLMNFGEAGIGVDGVLGPQTVDAIRAFQRRFGLPVTGEPDDAVIDKLEQIGALKKG